MKGADMLDTTTRPDTSLELPLELQPEESLEWKAQVNKRHTGWHDVESSSHLVALIQGASHGGDWLVVQTKGLDEQHFGRYAQAMNTGCGYHVEVAVVSSGVTNNWRIGLGPLADDAGNKPHEGRRSVTEPDPGRNLGGDDVLAERPRATAGLWRSVSRLRMMLQGKVCMGIWGRECGAVT